MFTNPVDVSVVIVNYNTIDLTLQCIQSVIDCTNGIKYEIIVIDNNSKDDLSAIVNHKFVNCSCDIICKKISENLGFGLGNNEGFKLARGRNFFCLNPDTIITNNALKILSDYLDKNERVGACGGNLYTDTMLPNHSFRRYLLGWRWELNILLFDKLEKVLYGKNTEFNYTEESLEVGYITGADLMVKRNVVQNVGAFSPDFFMYFEETDLCYRIKRKGYKIMNVPQAKIIHFEGGSFMAGEDAKINVKAIERSENGRIIYYRRNFHKVPVCFLNLIYFLALWLNKFVFKAKGNSIWKYYDYKLFFFKKACVSFNR